MTVMLRGNNKKIKLLLWLLIVTSVMLGFPAIKFGLLATELYVLIGYFTGKRGITTALCFLPVAHLSLLLLFPLAKSKHFFMFLLIIPAIFLIVAIWTMIIQFIVFPLTLFVLLPFIAVWAVLLFTAGMPKQIRNG